jgi:hypothetical protein
MELVNIENLFENVVVENDQRLSDEDIKGEQLTDEINRSKAITSIASQIIANGSLVLEAKKMMSDGMVPDDKLPKMLEG